MTLLKCANNETSTMRWLQVDINYNYDNDNGDSNHGATPTPQLDSDNDNDNDDNEGQGSRWCTDDNEEGSRRRVSRCLGSR